MRDSLVYIEEMDLYLKVEEGDGSNLSDEDFEEGYIDYIDYNIMKLEGDLDDEDAEMDILDGGMFLTKETLPTKYPDWKDAIDEVMNFHFGKKLDYELVYMEE